MRCKRYPKNASIGRSMLLLLVCAAIAVAISDQISRLFQPLQPTHYDLEPLPIFGMKVIGLDLSKPIHKHTVKQLKQDIFRHHLLLFQRANLTADQHAAFVNHLGTPNQRYKSTHPGLHIFKNGPGGHINTVKDAGTSYYHVDGAFDFNDKGESTPPLWTVQHMKVAAQGSSTKYIILNDFINQCAEKEHVEKWQRTHIKNNDCKPYPMLIRHPITNDPTILFQIVPSVQRMKDKLIFYYGSDQERQVKSVRTEFKEFASELNDLIDVTCKDLVYTHYWESGDIMLVDNLALAHAAGSGANLSVDTIGLRELWQSSIANTIPVKKLESIDGLFLR